MNENSYPKTAEEKQEWLRERIALCHDATKKIQEINTWATKMRNNINTSHSCGASLENSNGKNGR